MGKQAAVGIHDADKGLRPNQHSRPDVDFRLKVNRKFPCLLFSLNFLFLTASIPFFDQRPLRRPVFVRNVAVHQVPGFVNQIPGIKYAVRPGVPHPELPGKLFVEKSPDAAAPACKAIICGVGA